MRIVFWFKAFVMEAFGATRSLFSRNPRRPRILEEIDGEDWGVEEEEE